MEITIITSSGFNWLTTYVRATTRFGISLIRKVSILVCGPEKVIIDPNAPKFELHLIMLQPEIIYQSYTYT